MWAFIIIVLMVCSSIGAEEAAQGVAGYRLHPGDALAITVFGHPSLSTTARVGVDGSIACPLIGRVSSISGMTVNEIEATLTERFLDGYLKEVTVSVQVSEVEPKMVYVMGAVIKPGSIALSPYLPMTSLQAIAQCGGFQAEADRGAAVILRGSASEKGRFQHHAVPNSDTPSELKGDTELRGGDLIVVPRLGRIYVMGRVRAPGAITLLGESRTTVSRAISMAGGFDTFAVDEEVQLIRDGDAEPVLVDVRAILAGREGVEDPVLSPGDIVSVRQSRF